MTLTLAADADTARRHAHRVERRALRRVLRRVTHSTRLAACGRHRVPGRAGVTVRYGDGVAGLGDVQRCGSVWSCPDCAARVRAERGRRLEAAAHSWLRAGNSLAFVTLTLPHHVGDDLATLFGWLQQSLSKMQKGRALAADRAAGVAGWVAVREVTYGRNGWHPHAHMLLFLDGHPSADAHAALGARWYARWSRTVASVTARQTSAAAYRWLPCHAGSERALSEYLVKVQDGTGLGVEMTRGDLKVAAGVTPFQLLHRVEAGDTAALGLWLEYEHATKGRRFMTSSTSLDLDQLVADADDAVAARTPGLTVRVLTDREWVLVRDGDLVEDVLVAVERAQGDPAAVDRVLARHARRVMRRHRLRRGRLLVGQGLLPGRAAGLDPGVGVGPGEEPAEALPVQ